MRWIIRLLDFRLFNGAGNGGGGGGGGNGGGGNGGAGSGGQNGNGGYRPPYTPPSPPPAPVAPAPPATPAAPKGPTFRAARNVQRANIDRSSYYDPSAEALQMGREYLQSRSASNPRPPGDTGVGAVGYEFAPSTERLY